MVSVSIPGIGKIILGFLVNFVMLDILQTELWFTMFVSPPNSEGLNQIFEENGYDSKNIFDNLGSTFIFGMLLCLLYGFYGFLWVITKFTKKNSAETR